MEPKSTFVLMKLKNNIFYPFNIKVVNGDLFVFKKNDTQKQIFMQILNGTYIKIKLRIKLEKEHVKISENSGLQYKFKEKNDLYKLYPLKLVISEERARLFYFCSKKEQTEWYKFLCQASKFRCVYESYEFQKEIGKGEYGVVFKAKHLKN